MRIRFFVLALFVVGAMVVAHGASSTAATAASTPRCAPADLGIHFVRGEGAAGSRISRFQFINVSRRTCTLRGYPGISANDRRGHRLSIRVIRSGGHVKTVRLRPHGRATVVMMTSETPPSCLTARHLRFIPPNDFSSLQIRVSVPICQPHHDVFVYAVGHRL
jgi:hypothetical protein